MLISTKPSTKGQEAVLYRARQITDCRWTPICNLPSYHSMTGRILLPAGVERIGLLYSGSEPVDKFFFENVSFETFVTALANPDSVLYNKDLNGHNNSWAYYGMVCNGMARYALNIRRRFSTKRWELVPGMHKIHDAGTYTAEDIQICDVLHAHCKAASHVAMITDVLRDEDGVIRQIEVSEMVRPVGKRVQYDVDVYFEKFKLYAIWRYDYIDNVPMPDAREAEFLANGLPAPLTVAVDHGNKSNYYLNEDVVISAFPAGNNVLEIRRGDELVETITIAGRGKVARRFDRGYYTVTHKATCEVAEFAVVTPKISHSVQDGYITVTADPCDPHSKILYTDFREAGRTANNYSASCAPLAQLEELTEEEKAAGTWTRKIPEEGVHFKVYFENKYGIWTQPMTKI